MLTQREQQHYTQTSMSQKVHNTKLTRRNKHRVATTLSTINFCSSINKILIPVTLVEISWRSLDVQHYNMCWQVQKLRMYFVENLNGTQCEIPARNDGNASFVTKNTFDAKKIYIEENVILSFYWKKKSYAHIFHKHFEIPTAVKPKEKIFERKKKKQWSVRRWAVEKHQSCEKKNYANILHNSKRQCRWNDLLSCCLQQNCIWMRCYFVNRVLVSIHVSANGSYFNNIVTMIMLTTTFLHRLFISVIWIFNFVHLCITKFSTFYPFISCCMQFGTQKRAGGNTVLYARARTWRSLFIVMTWIWKTKLISDKSCQEAMNCLYMIK